MAQDDLHDSAERGPGNETVCTTAVQDVTAAVVQATPEERKKDVAAAGVQAVTAAAVQAAPDDLKKDVTAAAVQAAPDDLKKDVTAAAVQAAPDDLKKDISAAAAQATSSSQSSRIKDVEEALDRLATVLRDQSRGPQLIEYDGWVGVDVVDGRGRLLKIREDREVVLSPKRDYEIRVTIGPEATGSVCSRLCIPEGTGIKAPFVDFAIELDSDESALRQPPVELRVGLGEQAVARIPLRTPKDSTPAPWLWVRVTQRSRTIQSIELRTRP